MAPAQIPVFSVQKPSIENDQLRVAGIFAGCSLVSCFLISRIGRDVHRGVHLLGVPYGDLALGHLRESELRKQGEKTNISLATQNYPFLA